MALMKYFRWSDSKEKLLVEEKVFENPVILQVILKHVLQKGKGVLCTQTAKTLRLVSTAWLLETNLLFRKSGQPLMFLTTENFHNFLASTSSERNNWVPPLSLSLPLVTFSFKCVSFPRTITRMEMNAPLSLATLVLQRSDILEGMRVLKLNIITKNNLLDKEDLAALPKCLNLGSSSLEELELIIDLEIFIQNTELQVTLNLSPMTNLKKMTIEGAIWRLDQNSIQDDFLGARLAKLEELVFQITLADTFYGDWCDNCVFYNVRSLKLLLFNKFESGSTNVPFSMESMQQILTTFPQVVHLQLGLVDARELDGLRYIFGHMGGQLESLILAIRGEILSEDEIDGLFIGAGREMVRRLKRDPALWGKFLDGDLEENAGVYTSSIRDLKSLQVLALQGEINKNTGQGGVVEPLKNLPSDLAFELGFMQLSELHCIHLNKSFDVSEEMALKWCKLKDDREIRVNDKILRIERLEREIHSASLRLIHFGLLLGLIAVLRWSCWW